MLFSRDDIIFSRESSPDNPLRAVFSTLFLVCGNVVKQGFSCLTHYTQYGAEAGIDDGDAKDNAY